MSTDLPSVLVVDDDVDTCQNLADILEDMDYEVDVAHNGEAALELFRSKAYDLALLDLRMPGMDGLTLYHEMRKVRTDTVAMIVTAYATTSTRQEALDAGAWKVLAKPVDFSELLPLVGEATSQPLVLVVDDDEDLCNNLWEMLRERNYRITLAHNEREANEFLGARCYQVVLVDLKLPDGDGGRVLDLVRQKCPEARAVLITGHRDEMEELVQQALQNGAEAVCYKPFDVPRLLQTIEQFSKRDE
jgi:two-component system, NtrC family, response regulator HydG